jgi:hypothetical protein
VQARESRENLGALRLFSGISATLESAGRCTPNPRHGGKLVIG